MNDEELERRKALYERNKNTERLKKIPKSVYIKQAKEIFKDDAWTDEKRTKYAMEARAQWMPRWMEKLGITDYRELDVTADPQVHLEYILTDRDVLKDLKREGGRERLFEKLTPEEQYIYLNEKGSEGRTYAEDLEGKYGWSKKNVLMSAYTYKKHMG